jgi:hypothetical protein
LDAAHRGSVSPSDSGSGRFRVTSHFGRRVSCRVACFCFGRHPWLGASMSGLMMRPRRRCRSCAAVVSRTEAVRTALRAAARRRVRSAIRDEVRRISADEADRERCGSSASRWLRSHRSLPADGSREGLPRPGGAIVPRLGAVGRTLRGRRAGRGVPGLEYSSCLSDVNERSSR